jgi:hypothetical protein
MGIGVAFWLVLEWGDNVVGFHAARGMGPQLGSGSKLSSVSRDSAFGEDDLKIDDSTIEDDVADGRGVFCNAADPPVGTSSDLLRRRVLRTGADWDGRHNPLHDRMCRYRFEVREKRFTSHSEQRCAANMHRFKTNHSASMNDD